MQYVKRYLGCEQDFLEVSVVDDEDTINLVQYQNEKNIIISIGNLQNLSVFTHVERLIITSGEAPENVSAFLETLRNLRELKLDYDETDSFTRWCVDISRLYNLELLVSRSSNNFSGVSNSKSLKTLVVNNWYDKDLSKLKGSSIDTLSIGGGKLRSLCGIEESSLAILSLSNLRNLKDVTCIEKIPLKILELDNCNNISCLDTITSHTLEYLMVYGKNQVPNSAFIKQYSHLKRAMLDIIIEDGDLSILDSLESAILLTDRRHYNRKNLQLPKSTHKYIISSIPAWRYIYLNRNI